MSNDLELRSSDGATVVPVRVVPRSSRTMIDGVHDGALRVRLKAPPVDGAANKALCTFLAKAFGVSKSQVEISSGERGRSKTVTVTGLTAPDVRRLLTEALV